MVQASVERRDGEAAEDLIGALHGVLQVFKRTVVDPVDRAMVFVLAEIQRTGPVRPSDLAELVGLDGSTVSRHVSGLVERGLVERSRDPQDARAQRLVTTEAGRDLLHEVRRTRAAALDAAMTDWSTADRDRLVRLLNRLGEDLARSAADPARPTT